MLPSEPYLYQSVVSCWKVLKVTKSSQSQTTTITSQWLASQANSLDLSLSIMKLSSVAICK